MSVSKDYFCGVCRFFARMRCVASTTQRTEQDSNSEGDDNRFTLYTSSEFTDMDCCGQSSQMEGCKMKIDVKCAKTIRHSSHSHPHNHKPLVLNRIPSGGKTKMCHGCRDYLKECTSVYCCSSDDHDFAFHLRCAMQPKSIRKHEWDTNRI